MSTALVGCGQTTPAQKQNALQSWIVKHVVPLKTTDSQAPLDDLLPLKPLIGTASLVGLGERPTVHTSFLP
jgi:erythromycin esterase